MLKLHPDTNRDVRGHARAREKKKTLHEGKRYDRSRALTAAAAAAAAVAAAAAAAAAVAARSRHGSPAVSLAAQVHGRNDNTGERRRNGIITNV